MKKIFTLLVLMMAVVGAQAYDKNIDLSSPTTSGATWDAATSTVTFTSTSGYVDFAVSGVDTYTSIDIYISAVTNNFGIYIIGTNSDYYGFGATNKNTDGTALSSAQMRTVSTNYKSEIGSITAVRIKARQNVKDKTVTIPSICFKGLDVNSNTEGFGGLSSTGAQTNLLIGLKALPYTINQSGVNYLLGNTTSKDGTSNYLDVTDYDAIYFHISDYANTGQLRAFIGTSAKGDCRYAHKISDEVSNWTSENSISDNGWYYISLSDVTALRAIATQQFGQANTRFTVNQMYLTKSTFTMTDGKDACDIVYNPLGATIEYDRAFTAGQKSTICLPFALTQDEANTAGTFYEMTAASASGITFTQVTSGGTTAYKPYIFEAKATGTPFSSLSNKAIVASAGATTSYDVSGYTFHGTLAAQDVTSGAYGYSGGAFKKAGTGVTIKAFRGYITAPANAPALLNIDFIDGMGGTTGISEVKSTEGNDGVMYNLQGQRVGESHKGLVIKNGRKYVIK